ncbi:hypothetical protein ACJJTC_016819 [Scirpophaga incertulas]
MVWLRNTYIRQRNRDSVQDCRIHSIISHEKNDGYNEVDALGQLTIVENEKKRKYVIVAFEMESMHMWQHIPLSVKTSAGHRGGWHAGGREPAGAHSGAATQQCDFRCDEAHPRSFMLSRRIIKHRIL